MRDAVASLTSFAQAAQTPSVADASNARLYLLRAPRRVQARTVRRSYAENLRKTRSSAHLRKEGNERSRDAQRRRSNALRFSTGQMPSIRPAGFPRARARGRSPGSGAGRSRGRKTPPWSRAHSSQRRGRPCPPRYTGRVTAAGAARTRRNFLTTLTRSFVSQRIPPMRRTAPVQVPISVMTIP